MHASQSFNKAAPATRLIELTREHRQLLPQLVGQDVIHEFGARSVGELLKYRIGDGSPHCAKTAFALTDPEARTVYAAIYIYKTVKPITTFPDVPGNVAHILQQNALTQLPAPPTANIFYSINNILKDDKKPLLPGAGSILIEELSKNDMTSVRNSTLSPIWSLGSCIDLQPDEILSADERYALAYLHLMSVDRENKVQGFHMGNGAMIGDIKIDSNVKGSKDHDLGLNVMVNYDYTLSDAQFVRNRELFLDIRRREDKSGLVELMHPNVLERVEKLNGLVSTMAERMSRRSGMRPIVA